MGVRYFAAVAALTWKSKPLWGCVRCQGRGIIIIIRVIVGIIIIRVIVDVVGDVVCPDTVNGGRRRHPTGVHTTGRTIMMMMLFISIISIRRRCFAQELSAQQHIFFGVFIGIPDVHEWRRC